MFFAFLCALFSKENAIVIPVILSAYILFFYKETGIKYFLITTVFVTAVFMFFFLDRKISRSSLQFGISEHRKQYYSVEQFRYIFKHNICIGLL